jgi:hypothetical protein
MFGVFAVLTDNGVFRCRVAITSFKQIFILNMSKIAANRVDGCIQIAPSIQSAVYALAWHPEKANVLAFSTKEGRVGFLMNFRKRAV